MAEPDGNQRLKSVVKLAKTIVTAAVDAESGPTVISNHAAIGIAEGVHGSRWIADHDVEVLARAERLLLDRVSRAKFGSDARLLKILANEIKALGATPAENN